MESVYFDTEIHNVMNDIAAYTTMFSRVVEDRRWHNRKRDLSWPILLFRALIKCLMFLLDTRPSYPIKSVLHLDISQLQLLQALLDIIINPCIVAYSVSINQVDRFPFKGLWSATLGVLSVATSVATSDG